MLRGFQLSMANNLNTDDLSSSDSHIGINDSNKSRELLIKKDIVVANNDSSDSKDSNDLRPEDLRICGPMPKSLVGRLKVDMEEKEWSEINQMFKVSV